MTEMMLAMAILSVLSMISLRAADFEIRPYYSFPGMYLMAQSEALAEAASGSVEGSDDAASYFTFNASGNVSRAAMLYFSGKGNSRRIAVELGTGRLVMKDE